MHSSQFLRQLERSSFHEFWKFKHYSQKLCETPEACEDDQHEPCHKYVTASIIFNLASSVGDNNK
jgi:hypothetical protein